MENAYEDRKDSDFSIENPNFSEDHTKSHPSYDAVIAEFEALKISYQELRSRSMAMEDNINLLQHQKDEITKQNLDFLNSLNEISIERDALRNELSDFKISAEEREEKLIRQREARVSELSDERSKKIRVFSKCFESIHSVRECLARIIEKIDEEMRMEVFAEEDDNVLEEFDLNEESKSLLLESRVVYKLAQTAESWVTEYDEIRRKEKKELENSVVSLTEENRDVSTLLRVALVEKEAVEKSLSRLKGGGEQKRVALLQIAERGLQKVGFGFMMGASTVESSDSLVPSSTGSARSDSSECEEEGVSLASTVEKIMKNLRLEITQLRHSLEGYRSDSERLQSLTEKQAQKIEESTLYIKDLEERENMLAQNVEELMMEISEAEEEVTRWREACELEVDAGKTAIEECTREVAFLREELEATKASLNVSNNKLKLKEELAAAAMAAQAAAERSLQLADSRSAGFRERIEELTRQLEEADSRSERRGHRRVRHICWPWRALRINPATARGQNVSRRMLPDMEALLHYTI